MTIKPLFTVYVHYPKLEQGLKKQGKYGKKRPWERCWKLFPAACFRGGKRVHSRTVENADNFYNNFKNSNNNRKLENIDK